MFNPVSYLYENISWYAPIYNISWIMFILFALILPLLFLAIFHVVPGFKTIQPPRSWKIHFKSYGYLALAGFVIFAFRLIPYWIFNDKILHFLGGGVAIGLIYEYFVVNFNLHKNKGIISFSKLLGNKFSYLIANLVILLLFSSFFSVFSELYEFVSKYIAGAEFDSSGLDTWVDIIYNILGANLAYMIIWTYKYLLKR